MADGRLKSVPDDSFLQVGKPGPKGHPDPPGLAPRRKQMRSRNDVVRRFIESRRPQDLDENGRTRFLVMLENMCKIASGRSPQAVAAFSIVAAYAYGKPKLAEEDQEAIRKGGIQIVYVNRPEVDPEIPFAKPELAAAPEFIEAEFEEEGK